MVKRLSTLNKYLLILLLGISVFCSKTSSYVSPFRFSMKIPAGHYEYVKERWICYTKTEELDPDERFLNARKLNIRSDSTYNYAYYLFTREYEYVYAQIVYRECWINYPIPIKEEYKKYLRELLEIEYNKIYQPIDTLSNGDIRELSNYFLDVTPFNDSTYVMIRCAPVWRYIDLTNQEITHNISLYPVYIIDLEKQKILWQDDENYKSIRMNFYHNVIECTKKANFKGKIHRFNQYGKKVK